MSRAMEELSPTARAWLDQCSGLHKPPPGAKAAIRSRLDAALAAPSSAALEAERGLNSAASAGGFPLNWVGASLVSGTIVAAALMAPVSNGVEVEEPPSEVEGAEARLQEPVEAEPELAESPAVQQAPAAKPEVPAETPQPVRRRTRKPRVDSAAPPLSLPRSPPERDVSNDPRPAAAPVSEVRAPNLAEEAALLGEAQAALRDGEPARALRSTRAHERRFPKGLLREERMAAQALALCELGRFEQARVALKSLRSLSPNSPHLARVEAACR